MSALLALLARLARLVIRGIDFIVRRAYGVAPFSQDAGCFIRIALGRSSRSVVLFDGVRVERGSAIVHLHLWNERLLDLPRAHDSLGWGLEVLHHAEYSLHLLARCLDDDPAAAAWVALRGEFGFVTELQPAKSILERLGFDVALKEAPGFRIWRRAFWDNFYSFLLLWTFGPHGLRGKRLGRLQRVEIWMSRARLIERYGAR